VTASGAKSFHGTDILPNQSTCSSVLGRNAASNGGEVQLNVLSFGSSRPAGAFQLSLDNYKGPGTYTLTANDANITFLLGTSQYNNSSASTISAVAQSDDSVSVNFSMLVNGADQSQKVSGHAQFTCGNS